MTETVTRSVNKAIALCLTGANIHILRLPVEGSDKRATFLKFEIPQGDAIYINLAEIREIIFDGHEREATITYHDNDHETVVRGDDEFRSLMEKFPVQLKGSLV